MKILCMTHPTARAVRKHPAIKDKKLLGCGQFSAVFEGSTPESVLKLTVDPSAYWLFNDGVVGVKGAHFPKTLEDYDCVGDVVIHANLRAGRPREVPVFLYEQEKLVSLPMKCDQRRLAKTIIEKAKSISRSADSFKNFTGRIRDVDDARVTLETLAETAEGLPESIKEAVTDLARYCDYYDDLFLDMHFGNFMVRPSTGDLIFSDPFACASIFRGHKNYDLG